MLAPMVIFGCTQYLRKSSSPAALALLVKSRTLPTGMPTSHARPPMMWPVLSFAPGDERGAEGGGGGAGSSTGAGGKDATAAALGSGCGAGAGTAGAAGAGAGWAAAAGCGAGCATGAFWAAAVAEIADTKTIQGSRCLDLIMSFSMRGYLVPVDDADVK